MSQENIFKGIALMLLSATTVSIGQLMWKIGVDNNNIIIVFFGFIFYAVGSIFMVIAYRFGSVSVLQPIISFSYILSLILGYFILGEKINLMKLYGILFIIFGIIILNLRIKIDINNKHN